MPDTDLQPFIDAAKQRGASDEFLAALLMRQGWSASDVYRTLGTWWERDTGLAVPARHGAAENARDAFLYLLAFSTLATWASALGSLWFRLIERWLPDQVVDAYPYYSFRSTVTWQMAAILVGLPIYLAVMRMILRETRTNPERMESGVRKWLTYLALFLAASGVVSDLVCFADYFLKGELTLRFVLKCFTVLAICGSIFSYYLGFLRGRSRGWRCGIASVAAASAALGLGLLAAGTPRIQRQIEADNRRVQDLQAIAQAIAVGKSLPESLPAFGASRPFLHLKDPESGAPYEYNRNSDAEYMLCAMFTTSGDPQGPPYGSGFWSHARGRACFTLDRARPVPWQ